MKEMRNIREDLSKDRNENVKIMYHSFDESFNKSDKVYWFSSTQRYAEEFSNAFNRDYTPYKAFLNCNHSYTCKDASRYVFDVTSDNASSFSEDSLKIVKDLECSLDDFREVVEDVVKSVNNIFEIRLHDIFILDKFAQLIYNRGYDSIEFKERGQSYIGVFNPINIKVVFNHTNDEAEEQMTNRPSKVFKEYFDELPDKGYDIHDYGGSLNQTDYPIYVTDEVYSVVRLLERGDKPYRILDVWTYDNKASHYCYMLQDAGGNKTHGDMFNKARELGYLSNDAFYEDECYMVFIPKNFKGQLRWHTSLGVDNYYDCMVYPFGVMYVRDAYAYNNSLFQALGEPERVISYDDYEDKVTMKMNGKSHELSTAELPSGSPDDAITYIPVEKEDNEDDRDELTEDNNHKEYIAKRDYEARSIIESANKPLKITILEYLNNCRYLITDASCTTQYTMKDLTKGLGYINEKNAVMMDVYWIPYSLDKKEFEEEEQKVVDKGYTGYYLMSNGRIYVKLNSGYFPGTRLHDMLDLSMPLNKRQAQKSIEEAYNPEEEFPYTLEDIMKWYPDIVSNTYESCGPAFIMPDGRFLLTGKRFDTHADFAVQTLDKSGKYPSYELLMRDWHWDDHQILGCFTNRFNLIRVNDGSKEGIENRAYFVILQPTTPTQSQYNGLLNYFDYITIHKPRNKELMGYVDGAYHKWYLDTPITSEELLDSVKYAKRKGYFDESLKNNKHNLKETIFDYEGIKEFDEDTLKRIAKKQGNTQNYMHGPSLLLTDGTIINVSEAKKGSGNTHHDFFDRFEEEDLGDDALEYAEEELGVITLNAGDTWAEDRVKIVCQKAPTSAQCTVMEHFIDDMKLKKHDKGEMDIYANNDAKEYKLRDYTGKELVQKIRRAFVLRRLEEETKEDILDALDKEFGQEDVYMWSTYILPNGHFLNPDNSKYFEDNDEPIQYEHCDFSDWLWSRYHQGENAMMKNCMKMNVTYPYITIPEDRMTAEQYNALRKIIKNKDGFEPVINDCLERFEFITDKQLRGIKIQEPLLIESENDAKLYDLSIVSADDIIKDIQDFYRSGSFLSEALNEMKGTSTISNPKIIKYIEECIEELKKLEFFSRYDYLYLTYDDIDFKEGETMNTFGQMSMPKSLNGNYTLTLNKHLYEEPEEAIKNTILHELCHYIVMKTAVEKGRFYFKNGTVYVNRSEYYDAKDYKGHGRVWKSIARQVGQATGQDITRTNSYNTHTGVGDYANDKINYIVKCKHCGTEFKYTKKTKFVQSVIEGNGHTDNWWCNCKDGTKCHDFEIIKGK